jgi:ABC-2 type transport system ATP-binding protein
MSHVITIRDLTKRFGGKTAVDRLSLNIPAGAIYALLGDNGAGKSTTIKVLTGQHPPDGGRCEILGQDCWAQAVDLRRKVGYVPERPRFYDWMSVKDIGWFVAGFHAHGFLYRYLEFIHGFRLDPGARLKTLSKGAYAKVGLALALAVNPEVLILDEPTSGLDLLTRREFLSSMVDMAGVGRTILICSHQIAEVERVASHVAILAEGKLLLAEPLDELKRNFVRIVLRHDGVPPSSDSLGTVLERKVSGRYLDLLLRCPNSQALQELRQSPNVFDYKEALLNLEEIYTAVLSRSVEPRRLSDLIESPASTAFQEGR